MDLITVPISMKETYLQVSSAYVNVFVIRLWVWHRICDETVGVTGFVMRLWVWHKICDVTVRVTQDLWWHCVWHRICDETVVVTQNLWWDCGCDTGFVMWLWVWDRICEESDFSFVNCHIVSFFGAWGSVVVKAQRYDSGCPGIDSRWCQWGFFRGSLRNHVPWGRLSLRK